MLNKKNSLVFLNFDCPEIFHFVLLIKPSGKKQELHTWRKEAGHDISVRVLLVIQISDDDQMNLNKFLKKISRLTGADR